MTKIMLVEDDKSLREIYGVRLLAEGYDIVSAGDGEEALAMAIKERPQLIVSDVMMPKVSGYDMLDILRSTTETKNIRVIMMTALSSEEQRQRAESLGADRYLVKSQVGIEDVVRVVHEVLEDTPETLAAAAQPVVPQPAQPAQPAAIPPVQPIPAPIAPIQPAPTPLPQPVAAPQTSIPVVPVSPTVPVAPMPMPAPDMSRTSSAPKPASLKSRIIQPLNDPSISPININDLLDRELAKEAGLTDLERPVVETMDQEKAAIDEQLRSFTPPEPSPVESAGFTPPAPTSPSLLPTPGVGNTQSYPPTTTPQTVAAVEPMPPQAPPVAAAPATLPQTPTTPVAQPTAMPTPNTVPTASPMPVYNAPAPSAPTPLPEVPRVS